MIHERKRAANYARQSHGKQVSIEDQTREGRAVCDANGWDATDYSDKVSASRFGTQERGGWSDLVTDVTAGKLDVVILWDATRGDRTPSTWAFFLERCRKHNVQIHAVRDRHTYSLDSPRDWKTLHDAGVDAGYESEVRSSDVRRGVAGAALKGKAHGRAAWGYRRVYDEHDRKVFTQVPDENAPVVKEIIERIARRDPIVHICDDLDARGIAAPGGGKWHRNSLRQVAQRPTYAGLRGHNGSTTQGDWEPIVDEATWREAQAVLDDPKRKTTQPGRFKWLLSYVARCAVCDAYMQGTNGHKGRKDTYHCAKGCAAIGVWEADIYIKELVCARLAREDAREVFAADDEASALARLKVSAVNKELDDLTEQLAAGAISAMLAGQAEQGIRRRLAEAERELQRHTRHGALMALLDVEDVREAWDALAVAGKRSVLDVLFERIEVGPAEERLTRWSKPEDRVRLASERTSVTWS